jgi:hypothetical protein
MSAYWWVVAGQLRTHTNHWSGNVLWGLPLFFFAGLSALAARGTRPRWAPWLVLVVSVLSIPTVMLLDRCNVLVEYERWLRRGMPEAVALEQCFGPPAKTPPAMPVRAGGLRDKTKL